MNRVASVCSPSFRRRCGTTAVASVGASLVRSLGAAALVLIALVSSSSLRPAVAADGLKPGDYVAVIGDSITEQRLYSMFIEDYLLMCKPQLDLRATQFGWGGETAPGFAGRMANDCLVFKPTVATTCFGMNDGGYSPLNDEKAQRYRNGQIAIVKQLKFAGARFIVVGSPGAVDLDKFRNDPKAAEMYNKTLAGLRDIARDVAKAEGISFADVFTPMLTAMPKAKAKYGKDYHVCGGDGFHPDRNGHLIMAYAFLKSLGCDGHIGTITVDMGQAAAEATDGHKVLKAGTAASGVNVELESSRYPFCFYGEADKPGATRGIIEFFPFNEDLNRFMLVVKNPGGDKVRVTWGPSKKEFTAAQLAAGVNLAAEMLDNPFSGPFAQVEQKIAEKQGMEVQLVKSLLHNLPLYKQFAPSEAESLDRIAQSLVAKDVVARDAAAAAVKPVKHVITLELVK